MKQFDKYWFKISKNLSKPWKNVEQYVKIDLKYGKSWFKTQKIDKETEKLWKTVENLRNIKQKSFKIG